MYATASIAVTHGDTVNNLPTHIKAFRRQHGLSAEQLGRMIGRKRLCIYKWEAGKAQPNLDSLRALVDAGVITAHDAFRYSAANDDMVVAAHTSAA